MNEEEFQALAESYDNAVEAYRADPTDETKATKDALAEEVVAARQAERYARQGVDVAATNGDAVAAAETVEATTEGES